MIEKFECGFMKGSHLSSMAVCVLRFCKEEWISTRIRGRVHIEIVEDATVDFRRLSSSFSCSFGRR